MLRRQSSILQGIKSVLRTHGVSKSTMSPAKLGGKSCEFHLSNEELVDIMTSGKSSSGRTLSPWKAGNYPREGLLWPNLVLESTRGAHMSDSVSTDRLTQLWSLSNSHGISWDELDQKFIEFHKEYISREAEWVSQYENLWDTEYKKSEEGLKRILKKTVADESQLALVLNRRRGKIRRMTYSRISRIRFSEVLRPFHLKQFMAIMKQFATNKIAQREANERASLE